MQMDATARPNPADLQAQLAPHLFGSGSDDSGTASAWLPERAVGLIETRRGGRPSVRAAAAARGGRSPAAAAVPRPVARRSAPARCRAARAAGARRRARHRAGAAGGRQGAHRPRPAGRRRPRRRREGAPAGGRPRRVLVPAARRRQRRRPRRGPTVARARRPRAGGARRLAALAFPHVERRLGHPVGRRRPRLRHLLRGPRPGRGHRPPPVQDAGRGLVDGGRGRPYPRLRRAHAVRAGRPRGHRPVAAVHGRLGVLAEGRPGHRRHRHPRRRRPGVGGVERAEAVGDHRRRRRTSSPRRPAPPSTTARCTSGRTPGCARWTPARARSAGRTRSATRPPAAAYRCGSRPPPTATCTSPPVPASSRWTWRQRPGPLALRGAGGVPLPADLRAGPRGDGRRRLPRRLPRHGVRPGRHRRPRPLAHRHRGPRLRSTRYWSPRATSTWAAARGSTPWTR